MQWRGWSAKSRRRTRTSTRPPSTALRTLIRETSESVAAIKPQALAGAENRKVEMRLEGPLALEADGLHFICRWSLPNFYFHVVTAYDILRHKGLAIGKRDYMSHVGPFLRPHQAA